MHTFNIGIYGVFGGGRNVSRNNGTPRQRKTYDPNNRFLIREYFYFRHRHHLVQRVWIRSPFPGARLYKAYQSGLPSDRFLPAYRLEMELIRLRSVAADLYGL